MEVRVRIIAPAELAVEWWNNGMEVPPFSSFLKQTRRSLDIAIDRVCKDSEDLFSKLLKIIKINVNLFGLMI